MWDDTGDGHRPVGTGSGPSQSSRPRGRTWYVSKSFWVRDGTSRRVGLTLLGTSLSASRCFLPFGFCRRTSHTEVFVRACLPQLFPLTFPSFRKVSSLSDGDPSLVLSGLV